MGHGRGKSCSSPEVIPPKVADYNVTGNGNPSPNCNYFYTGLYAGKSYYRREDGAYFLFWDDEELCWRINIILSPSIPGWRRDDPNIEGVYYAEGIYSGSPVVAAGPH